MFFYVSGMPGGRLVEEVMAFFIEDYVEWYFILKVYVKKSQQCKSDWKRTIGLEVMMPLSLFAIQLHWLLATRLYFSAFATSSINTPQQFGFFVMNPIHFLK